MKRLGLLLVLVLFSGSLMGHQAVAVKAACSFYELHGDWALFDDGTGTLEMEEGTVLSIRYKDNGGGNRPYQLSLDSEKWKLRKNDAEYTCDNGSGKVKLSLYIEEKTGPNPTKKAFCLYRIKDAAALSKRPGQQEANIDQMELLRNGDCEAIRIQTPGHSHADR